MVKKYSGAVMPVLLFFLFFIQNVVAQSQIYLHNFGTTNTISHPYQAPPTTLATNLSGSEWTNSTNTWITYAGNAGRALGLDDANGETITLTVNIAPNYQVEISSFDFWCQRSSAGPRNWSMTINGINAGNSGTNQIPTNGSMRGVTPVANAVTGITGTLRVVISLSGATGAANGNFRLDDFTLNGIVTPTCTPPVVSSFTPTSGPKNTLVTINGSGFTGATAVTFGTTPATSYTVVSNTQITALVPAGAGNTVTVAGPTTCPGTATTNYTLITPTCPPVPDEIYISEVYDQFPGNPGVVELYNPTSAQINFTGQYTLERYQDTTDTTPDIAYTLTLTGSIASHGVYLVSYGGSPSCGGLTFGATYSAGINDNDAIKLKKNGEIKDVANAPNVKGYDLIRKPNAIAPTANYTSSDWNITHNGGGAFSGCADLGRHTADPSVLNPSTVTSPIDLNLCEGGNGTFTIQVTPAGSYTYQWKTLNTAGAWVNVTNANGFSGATTASLSVTAAANMNGTQYYCQVTTASCNLITGAARLYVSQIPAPSATATQPDCTTPTGTITVTSVTGATYSIDGTNYVTGNIFTGLASGTYPVTIRNAAGCTSAPVSITINAVTGAPAAPAATATQPDCTTATGTITVTPVAGVTYSIDGTNYVANNIFTGLVPGTYSVTIRNAAGCTSAVTSVTINAAPSAPSAPVVAITQPDCTTATGTITVTLVAGATYSIDGTNYVTNNIFTGLIAGTYPVTLRNAAGCTSAVTSVTINTAPTTPVAPVATPTQPDCTTSTGTITVTPVAGTTYSIDGTNYVTNNVFTGLVAGTYPVTVRNAAGCTSAITSVTINAAPATPSAPLVTTIHPDCVTPTGTITVTPVAGATYSIDGTNYVTNNIFAGLASGTYPVTIRNAAGCTSAVTTVVLNPVAGAPVAPGVSVTQPDCTTATGSITVTVVSGATYSIDGVNYGTSNVFTGLTPGTYPVTIRNAAGCTSAVNTAVVNAAPSTPAAPAPIVQQPNCTTTTGTITIPTTTGYTYSIDGVTYGSNNIFSGLSPATYPVTVRNAAGCTSAITQIIINPAPSIPAPPTVSVIHPDCATPTGTITVTPVAGVTYSIDGVNYITSNTFSGLAPGNYDVTVKNAGGCASSSVRVTVSRTVGPPQPSIYIQQPNCPVPSGTITIGAVAGYTYSIDGVNYGTNNVFPGLAPGVYPISVRSASGCVSLPRIETIDPIPTAPAAPVVTVIHPDCTTPTGTININPIPGGAYSINGITYETSPIFTNLAPGTYSVIVRNAGACISPATVVTINPAPAIPVQPIAAVTQPDCTTSTGTITITPVTGETYSIDGVNYGTTTVFTGLIPGRYNITAKNATGCISPVLTVTVIQGPAIPVAPVVTAHQPDCTTSTGYINVALVSGATYSIDGINYQGLSVFDNLSPGTYQVTVRNIAGCVSPATSVTINTPPAVPATPAPITGNAFVCMGETLQLASATAGGTWSLSNNIAATIDTNGLLTGVREGLVTVTYTIAVPGITCTSSVSMVVEVYAQPQPVLDPEYFICKDNLTGQSSSVYISCGLSGTGYTFVWEKDGQVQPVTTPWIDASVAGQYKVTVTNAAGCVGTATTVVKESSKAIGYAEVAEDFHSSQTVTVHVTGGSGNYEYSMDGSAFQSQPYFTGVTQGAHLILVNDINGCGQLHLAVFAIDYPKFFTPNNDGTNDYWHIPGLDNQAGAVTYVFDRYGKLITSITPGSKGWDGTLNGHPLPATDYWFKVLYKNSKGEEREFLSHFSLIR
nr:T9SS type B sorting domain-containing protein [uncultured Flavobacterium sp.]